MTTAFAAPAALSPSLVSPINAFTATPASSPGLFPFVIAAFALVD
jgi:hypothetical protein